MEKIDKW